MSNETRTAAHAAIDRASPEDLARVAHDLVNDLSSVIDAIAAQAVAQTRNYLFPARPSTSPPPSKETEAELLQERQAWALERICYLLEPLAVQAKCAQYLALHGEQDSWSKHYMQQAFDAVAKNRKPNKKASQ